MFRYSDVVALVVVVDFLAVGAGVGFNDCVDVDPHAASSALPAITVPIIYLRRIANLPDPNYYSIVLILPMRPRVVIEWTRRYATPLPKQSPK